MTALEYFPLIIVVIVAVLTRRRYRLPVTLDINF